MSLDAVLRLIAENKYHVLWDFLLFVGLIAWAVQLAFAPYDATWPERRLSVFRAGYLLMGGFTVLGALLTLYGIYATGLSENYKVVSTQLWHGVQGPIFLWNIYAMLKRQPDARKAPVIMFACALILFLLNAWDVLTGQPPL